MDSKIGELITRRLHLNFGVDPAVRDAWFRATAHNLLQQQALVDEFIHEYNFERPHQALERPGDLYQRSPRTCRGLPELEYPLHEHTLTVSACSRICFATKKVNLSNVFAGQKVGIKGEDKGIWQVSFMDYEIGDFDLETCRVEPVDNPFGPKVSTRGSV